MMPTKPKHKPAELIMLDYPTRRAIASAAQVAEKTLSRALAGQRIRPTGHARIRAELVRRGLIAALPKTGAAK